MPKAKTKGSKEHDERSNHGNLNGESAKETMLSEKRIYQGECLLSLVVVLLACVAWLFLSNLRATGKQESRDKERHAVRLGHFVCSCSNCLNRQAMQAIVLYILVSFSETFVGQSAMYF